MRSRSLGIYPRIDKEYTHKSSLDFQMNRSNIFLTRKTGICYRLQSWVAFFIVGILMGGIAFLIDLLTEELVLQKWTVVQYLLKNSVSLGWITYVVFGALFGGVAVLITAFIAPGAAGGGSAELMGFLNGVKYPSLISVKTLIVKIIGLSLAVASGLCIGKEAPLAHIGAIVGILVVYIPLPYFEFFRNDEDKREIAAAGCAAGVAAAFGSPIGGSLFSYEISRPSTYWSFGLTWKIFFCSSVSTFFLNILHSLRTGESILVVNAGLIKLGQYDEHPYKLHDFPFFLLIGMLGGLLGAFFIFVNYNVNKIRKKLLDTKWKKVIETLVLVVVTSTVIYFAPLMQKSECLLETESRLEAHYIQYLCPDGEFNALATILVNPENSIIKNFMSPRAVFNYDTLIIYFIIWYFFTVITYGTSVPAGIFLPGILIGCALGRMVGLFIDTYLVKEIHPSTYAIIGAAAILAGYTRLSFSLAVIMLETTTNVNLFLPIIFALFTSFGVGRIFNRSLYIGSVRFKNIPFLSEKNKIPPSSKKVRAEQMMSSPPYSLQLRASVRSIYDGLKCEMYNGFPIVDDRNHPIGLISRNFLSILLLKEHFMTEEQINNNSFISMEEEDNSQIHDTQNSHREDTAHHSQRFPQTNPIDANPSINQGSQTPPQSSQNVARKKDGTYFQFEDQQRETEESQRNGSPKNPSPIKEKLLKRLTWRDFNSDYCSSETPLSKVQDICEKNLDRIIDLKPFMIEKPHSVHETDRIDKVVEIFRLMNLRHLMVVTESDNSLIGIITRQDIFAYMSL